ncbi:MAG: hypothetical protein U0Y10_25305 [Spirosomataceae bacterium]
MKKLLTSVVVFCASLLICFNVSAQEKGSKVLGVGLGLNSYYSGGIPLGAYLEFPVVDNITVGPMIDYLSYNYASTYKFTSMYLGGRGSYHVNEILKIDNDQLDIYGGLAIGYRSFKWSDSAFSGLSGSYGSGLYYGLFAGARYYFSGNIGAFAELGATGSSNLRVGINLKL